MQFTNATSNALQYVLLDGDVPDDYVSVFSSFYGPQWDDNIEGYPLVDPPPGFPVLVAFNPSTEPPDERNWIVARAPDRTARADLATKADLEELQANLTAAIDSLARGCRESDPQ